MEREAGSTDVSNPRHDRGRGSWPQSLDVHSTPHRLPQTCTHSSRTQVTYEKSRIFGRSTNKPDECHHDHHGGVGERTTVSKMSSTRTGKGTAMGKAMRWECSNGGEDPGQNQGFPAAGRQCVTDKLPTGLPGLQCLGLTCLDDVTWPDPPTSLTSCHLGFEVSLGVQLEHLPFSLPISQKVNHPKTNFAQPFTWLTRDGF